MAQQPEVQALIEVVSQQQQQIEAQQQQIKAQGQQIEKLKDESRCAQKPELAPQFGATEPRPVEKDESQTGREAGEKIAASLARMCHPGDNAQRARSTTIQAVPGMGLDRPTKSCA